MQTPESEFLRADCFSAAATGIAPSVATLAAGAAMALTSGVLAGPSAGLCFRNIMGRWRAQGKLDVITQLYGLGLGGEEMGKEVSGVISLCLVPTSTWKGAAARESVDLQAASDFGFPPPTPTPGSLLLGHFWWMLTILFPPITFMEALEPKILHRV